MSYVCGAASSDVPGHSSSFRCHLEDEKELLINEIVLARIGARGSMNVQEGRQRWKGIQKEKRRYKAAVHTFTILTPLSPSEHLAAISVV